MTERLYYDNSYLTDFEATVTLCVQKNDETSDIYLNQSAFYPTSGGQPYDTGTINGCEVIDVYVDNNGDVAHTIKGYINEGSAVTCHIDWQRRFDHMQQHAGEHMLAGCVHRQLGGYTIGLHLGHEDSSIDVELPGGRMHLSNDELKALEDEVNADIQADQPILCYFPSEDELKKLPLRKAPAVSEHVRVVQIGEKEYCACGGTHPSSTGQIGLVKIVDARPSKGKLRLTFVCGMRAFKSYQSHMEAIKQLSSILSADISRLPDAASDIVAKLKDAQFQLNKAKAELAVSIIKTQPDEALTIDGITVIKHMFYNAQADALMEAAKYVSSKPAHIALLGSKNENDTLLLFAKSSDISNVSMGTLLSGVAKRHSGKGGGSAELARGSVKDDAALDDVLTELQGLLNGGAK